MQKVKELTQQQAKEATHKFIADKLKQAKDNLEAGKEVESSITILNYYPLEDSISGVDIPNAHVFFQNEYTKRLIKPIVAKAINTGLSEAAQLTRQLKKQEFEYQVAIVVVSDTYFYEMPKEEVEKSDYQYVRPSSHPEKKEAIACMVSMKEEDFAEVHPYIKVDEIVLYEQQLDMQNAEKMTGNMVGLYPK